MAGRSSVRVVKNDFKPAAARVRGEVSDTVRDITLDLLSQSVNRAPVDEGPLRGSGTAHFNEQRIASGADVNAEATGDEGVQGGHNTNETTGVVAFNTEYAMAQHERTDYAHPKGGEAKYLERPLEESRAEYLKALREAVKKGAE